MTTEGHTNLSYKIGHYNSFHNKALDIRQGVSEYQVEIYPGSQYQRSGNQV